jgi:hypothetical protein
MGVAMQSVTQIHNEATLLITEHQSCWFKLVGPEQVRRMTEMVVTELLIVRATQVETAAEASKLVKARIKARLKARRPKIHPIFLWILMQVVSVIVRVLIQKWWEKWKEDRE